MVVILPGTISRLSSKGMENKMVLLHGEHDMTESTEEDHCILIKLANYREKIVTEIAASLVGYKSNKVLRFFIKAGLH
jgi:hypothetical protein